MKLSQVVNDRWLGDQKRFEKRIADKFAGLSGFLASVRNKVARDSFRKKIKPSLSKDIAGRVLGVRSGNKIIQNGLFGEKKSLSFELVGMTQVSIDTRVMSAVYDANEALRMASDKLIVGPDYLKLNLSWDDDMLKDWANSVARRCSGMYEKGKKSIDDFRELVEGFGFKWVPSEHQNPPTQGDFFKEYSALLRVMDFRWWLRQARVLKVRTVDDIARRLGMVHAMGQPYASNEAVKIRKSQLKRNRSILEGMEAINQEGDAYTLAELHDLSVSNPAIRRAELMVRMRGFEDYAKLFGDQGLFITMSAPSRFHPMKQIKNKKGKLVKVIKNDKYDGSNQRDCQQWFVKTWSLIRAEFQRAKIECYGFRVVEPHADGTPHWHQLLFFKTEKLDLVKKIFNHYCFRTDAGEPGAKHHRVKIVDIDPAKGSATGYIAKYISKNIDGHGVDVDLFGNDSRDASARINAFASGWGIRQFQQIGGPSVTVWRELRRLEDAEGIAEGAREAADSANWCAYCLIQNNTIRTAPIRIGRWFEFSTETGEILTDEFNKYGEPSAGIIFGLICEGKNYLTRFYRWTIARIGSGIKVVRKALQLPVNVLSSDDLLDLLRGDGSGISGACAASDLCQ